MQYNIIHFDTLGSTNDCASAPQYTHGDVIVARNQTSGRGQRGNKWSAAAGQNLTFSLVIQPVGISVFEQFRISQMAAMAAADAVRAFGVECKVKWPNDLYINSKKIGGILIEHTSMGPAITKSILGIGVNVNQSDFPADLPNPTSLINLGVDTTPAALLSAFLDCFTQRYRQAHTELHQDYMQYLWHGTGAFRDAHGEFEGEIVNIDANSGMMSVERSNGGVAEYYFKEVEFIL